MESELIEIRDLEDGIFPITANEVIITLSEDMEVKVWTAEVINKAYD